MILGQTAFTGYVPRLPAHLQPENGANMASNCDFAHGELRALATDVAGATFTSASPVVSAFADTSIVGAGVKYTAAFTSDTWMLRSPVAEDTHNRYYFTGPTGGLRVVDNTGKSFPRTDVDPASFKVGCPTVPEDSFSLKPLVSYTREATARLDWTASSFFEVDGHVAHETVLAITPNWTEVNGEVTAGTWMEFTTTIAPPASAVFQPVGIYITAWQVAGSEKQVVSEVPGWGGVLSLMARILSATKIEVYAPGGGVLATIDASDTLTFWDLNGVAHNVMAYIEEQKIAQGIEAYTSPYVRLVGKDRTTHIDEVVLYSNGSGFALHNNTSLVPGGASLVLTKKPGDNNEYTLRVELSAVEKRYYCVTLVNQFGEESAPSLSQSIELNFFQDAKVTVTVDTAQFSGYAPVVGARLYRSATDGQGGAEFLLVFDSTRDTGDSDASWSVVGTTFTFIYRDHKKPEALRYALSTTAEWLPPPDNLRGLCATRAGVLAGFIDNVVHVSEPYRPYAWKISNAISLPHSVVALHQFANGLVAFTRGTAHFISGQGSLLSHQEIAGGYGQILNARAAVASEKGLLFATDDGICVTDGVSARTELGLFTRRDWQALLAGRGSLVRMAWWDGRLLVYFVGDDTGYLVDFDESGGALSQITGLGNIRCHYRLAYPDGVWAVDGLTLKLLFGGTGRRALSYTSRTWELPEPVCCAALQIRQEGATTVQVYADDVLKHTQSVTGNAIVRLPSGFRAHRWYYTLTRSAGQAGAVRSVVLSTSMEELKRA